MTLRQALVSMLNAAIAAAPRLSSYVDLGVPEAASGSGDAMAPLVISAILSIAPSTNRAMDSTLSTAGQQEAWDLAIRRIDDMITDLTTINTALKAVRPAGTTIPVVT